MLAEDLKFPMVVRWGEATYVVVDRGSEVDWLNIYGRSDRDWYHSSLSKQSVASKIGCGAITILAQPQPTTTLAKLTVDVDTSAITRATEAARELEQALKAVKDMLA